jgi:hypothetical protein
VIKCVFSDNNHDFTAEHLALCFLNFFDKNSFKFKINERVFRPFKSLNIIKIHIWVLKKQMSLSLEFQLKIH